MDSLLPENHCNPDTNKLSCKNFPKCSFPCGLRAQSGTKLKYRMDLPWTDCGSPKSKSYLANSIKYYKTRLLKYDHLYSHLVVEGRVMILPLMGFFGICSELQWKTTKIQLFPTTGTEKWGKGTQVLSSHSLGSSSSKAM